jgi:MFS family permease
LALVATIVMVDTMFYAAIAPLLPYYSHHFHLAKSQAGVLAATYAAGTLLGSLPAGWLAGRLGVRTTIAIGLGLMTLSSAVFAFAGSISLIDAARFVQGLGGAASWAGGLAWLVEQAPARRRGEVIGAALGAAIGGALLGPVLGTVAAETSPKLAFSLVSGIGLLLLLWALAEPAPSSVTAAGLRTIPLALQDRRVLTGMWLTALSALLYGTLSVLAPLRLSLLGAGTVVVGAAFLTGAALAGVASPLIGRLTDRRGLKPVVVGLCVSALWAVLLLLPRSVVPLFALVVLADPLFSLSYPAAGAMISHGADEAGVAQAYGFGLFNLAWAGGQVLGAAGSSSLAQSTSDALPYSLLASISVATALALARTAHIHRRTPR